MTQRRQAKEPDPGDVPMAGATAAADSHRLFSLLNAMPATIYLRAPNYSIRFANRRFRERYGEPESGPCYSVIYDRDAPCEPCKSASVLRNGRPVESERTFADGRCYQFYDHPFVDVDGTELVLQMGIDITDRKRAEAAFERTNRELLELAQAEHTERLYAEGLAEAVLAINSSLDWTDVLDRILEQTLRVIPCTAAAILLRENGRIQLAGQRGIETSARALESLRTGVLLDSVPVFELTCRRCEPFQIEDVPQSHLWPVMPGLEWVRSMATIPMIQDNRAIGLIALVSNRPGFFAREDLGRLLPFASHAVLAIENARLYQARSQTARTAEFLSAASLVMAQSLDLDTVLDNLLDIMPYLVSYDVGCVCLLESDKLLVPRAVRDYTGAGREEQARTLNADRGDDPHLQKLLVESKSVLVADIRRHPDWQSCLPFNDARSYLAVPLLAEGRPIGVCELVNREPDAFTQQHVWLAEALSAQAAVAVQNAWLFDRMRDSREQLQSLSRRLVDVQENERRYIAGELHDEAGQALTSLRIRLKLLQRQADDPVQVVEGASELLGMVEEVMENLHRLAADLRPASLDHLGLVAAVRQYCTWLNEQDALAVSFEAVGLDNRLPPDMETSLYRIVQEALSNVAHHAHASRVDVLLERRGERLRVLVEDDGLGFDPLAEPARNRLGLLGMEERARALGGELVVESQPNRGTTILVDVPYADPGTDR